MDRPSKSVRVLRMVFADSAAFLLFNAITGVFTLLGEVAIAGMNLRQWFYIRILFNVLKFAGARLLGKLTDVIRRGMFGTQSSPFKRVVADTIALALYQFPLYVMSAGASGATRRQIAIMSGMYLAEALMTGWLYGVILDTVRAPFVRAAARVELAEL